MSYNPPDQHCDMNWGADWFPLVKDDSNDLTGDLSDLTDLSDEEDRDSPPAKRQRVLAEVYSNDVASYKRFQATLWHEKKGASRSRAWQTALVQHPEYHSLLCNDWLEKLQRAFRPEDFKVYTFRPIKEGETLDEELYEDTVDVLCQMRLVTKSIYSTNNWMDLVKRSGLGQAMCSISHPRSLVTYSQKHHRILFRFHRFYEALLLVLYHWHRASSLDHRLPHVSSNDLQVSTSIVRGTLTNLTREFVKFLSAHPQIVPAEALPFSIFFLVHQTLFQSACERWLLDGMECLGFERMAELRQLYTSNGFYADTRKHVLDRAEHLNDPGLSARLLRCILRRTKHLKKLTQEWANSAFRNSPRKDSSKKPRHDRSKAKFSGTASVTAEAPSAASTAQAAPAASIESGRRGRKDAATWCPKCKDKAIEFQCLEYRTVTVRTNEELCHLHGKIISLEPDVLAEEMAKERMKPVEEMRKLIHHPSEVMLERVGPREHALKNCGRHRIIFETETGEMLDFFEYGAFDDTTLSTLQSNHSAVYNQTTDLKRGKQFDLGVGQMKVVGARQASGGRRGDAYTAYACMSADTEDGIETMFHYAEDSACLRSHGRAAHPGLVREAADAYQDLDRMGLWDQALYYCWGYGSQVHFDDDITPSLCCQIDWNAKPGEFAFIYLYYGLWMDPRSNCLWSFDGRKFHGTIIPAGLFEAQTDNNETDADNIGPRAVEVEEGELSPEEEEPTIPAPPGNTQNLRPQRRRTRRRRRGQGGRVSTGVHATANRVSAAAANSFGIARTSRTELTASMALSQ